MSELTDLITFALFTFRSSSEGLDDLDKAMAGKSLLSSLGFYSPRIRVLLQKDVLADLSRSRLLCVIKASFQ